MVLSDVSSERAVRAFSKAGFRIIRDKDKHTIMSNGNDTISIPRHKRLNPFTLKAIIEDAGLSEQEFKNLL